MNLYFSPNCYTFVFVSRLPDFLDQTFCGQRRRALKIFCPISLLVFDRTPVGGKGDFLFCRTTILLLTINRKEPWRVEIWKYGMRNSIQSCQINTSLWAGMESSVENNKKVNLKRQTRECHGGRDLSDWDLQGII